MALPKLATPTYELEIPSTDEKIKFRPFLVKEEKILMMAMESKSNADITQAVKDIVQECTFNKVKIDNMPMFDVEYIFLQIRSKSVGEVSKLKLLCPDDGKTYADVELDLNEVKVQVGDDHTNKIELGNDMGMIMKYPTIDSFDPQQDANQLKTEQLFDIIGKSIYQIYEGETVHNAKDYSKEEMQAFIESLTSDHFAKIQKFFNSMPRLAHEIEVVNPKTQVKSKVMLQGLTDFFVSPSHMTT